MDEVMTVSDATSSGSQFTSPPSSPASLLPVNIPLLSAFLACAIAQFLKLFTTWSSDESQMKSNARDGEAAGYLGKTRDSVNSAQFFKKNRSDVFRPIQISNFVNKQSEWLNRSDSEPFRPFQSKTNRA